MCDDTSFNLLAITAQPVAVIELARLHDAYEIYRSSYPKTLRSSPKETKESVELPQNLQIHMGIRSMSFPCVRHVQKKTESAAQEGHLRTSNVKG